MQVGGAVQRQQRLVAQARAGNQVPIAVLLPDLGVAKVHDRFLRRVLDDSAMLDEPDAVVTGGQALDLADKAFVTHFSQPGVPGVDQRQGVATHHRATGKTAVAVEVIAWRQGKGQMLPMDQVSALGVPPIHWPPFGIERVVLVEHVIFATEKHHAVRVVHPARDRRQMIVRSIIVDETRLTFTQRLLRMFKGEGMGAFMAFTDTVIGRLLLASAAGRPPGGLQ